MTLEQENKYKEILISPVRECGNYSPKFGHAKKENGYSFTEFLDLYGNDAFYHWLGLDHPLMYSAHKAAGGLTSIYRQIGIGCERLVRELFMDYLGLSEESAKWSYNIQDEEGKNRTLSLDARIIFNEIIDNATKKRVLKWKEEIAKNLDIAPNINNAISGIVFEVRQGYKSKDSKRQNADISNAVNAYANGYIPCLMVMSSQLDDDISTRYSANKWHILEGIICNNAYCSTYDFFNNVIGFDFVNFMNKNHEFFKEEIHNILDNMMRIGHES